MRIRLFSAKEFVELNEIQEITSPVLFQRGNIPHPEGLVSNQIFGITINARKNTYGCINLHSHFFHPLVYKTIRRFFRNIDKIVSGSEYYSIDSKGHLIPDENGETGIEFLYDNWEKIKWDYSDQSGAIRNERIDLVTKYKKDTVFVEYLIVIPPFYRDIKTGNKTAETGDLNKYYATAIRLANMIKERDMFGFQFHATNYEIQTLLVSIYDYFKGKLEKKNGLIRKYLMGKNVDYCTRTVITAPNFHAEKRKDMLIDFRHAGIPIAQICALANPFVMRWLKQFFEREVFDNKYSKMLYNPTTNKVEQILKLKNPESIFNEKFFQKMINTYIKDPGSRFNKIEVPVEGSNKKYYMQFNGKVLDSGNKSELASIVYRPMTWTDLLYMACEDVVRDKHCMITRYPLTDEYGIFIAKIRVLSTTETVPVSINGKVYKWYPIISFDTDEHKIASKFIDSVEFSNSYLAGIGGDYDGDQTTMKILFTVEANEECNKFIYSKSFYINTTYKSVRSIGNEGIQTLYTLTKDPSEHIPNKIVLADEVKKILAMNPDDLSFSFLVDLFGNRYNSTTKEKMLAKYKTTDTVIIPPGFYHGNKMEINTTIGRLIYNKIILEGSGVSKVTGFINKPVTDKENKKIEGIISKALADDIIDTNNMENYIDARDWIGMQLNTVIVTSFTPDIIKIPKEVATLKKTLLKKYSKELSENDPHIAEYIGNELVKKTKEVLENDPGMDLYKSGARGSIESNYKEMYLFRGAIKNEARGGYDIIENSLSEGLQKKDFAPHSNTILGGAYPKSVGTEVSGYMAKELNAALQTEMLGEEGSDCGTKKTLEILLTDKNKNKYIDRIIQVGNKDICLTSDIIDRYVGKQIHLYSPLFCTADHLCNKCAGNAFYKLHKKYIGLTCNKAATSCTNLNMKKFHKNLVTTKKIDLSDMLL